MELTGEHRIPATREVVWNALHDPDILKDCIKGCESLQFVSDDEITARVKAKVGPVSATFDGDIFLENSNPPESYTLRGEGKGGVAGFAKGSADVNLAEDGDETVLTYHAKATVGGKLAQLGSRLVDNTAKKYAADFFSTLSDKLTADSEAATAEAAGTAGAEPAEAPAEAAGAAAETPAETGRGTPPAPGGMGGGGTTVWILAAAAVAVAALVLFAIL